VDIEKDMTPARVAVAVDIGGTKVAVGLVDEAGHLTNKSSAPVGDGDAAKLTDRVLTQIEEAIAQTGREVVGIGVSVAAAIDRSTGDVLWAPNIPGWVDVPLGRLIQDQTHLPVTVGFDGHMAALGEHWAGAGRGTRNMVLIVIGTGIGGGLILDGSLYHGAQNLAGALGWMIVEPDLMETKQSRSRGNLEITSSGPAIVRSAAEMADARDRSSLQDTVTAESVIQQALDGATVSQEVIRLAGMRLGRAVVSIVGLLNPDLVLLGGGLGSTGVFLDAVREAVDSFAQPISRRGVRIEPASLGNDAGLVGAGRFVFQEIAEEITAQPEHARIK
jgi:glucokinase